MIFSLTLAQMDVLDASFNGGHEDWLWCCDGCDSVVVVIDEDDGIWVGGKYIDSRDLEALFKAVKYNGYGEADVVIQGYDKTTVSAYAQVADAAKLAGISNVVLSSWVRKKK